MIWDERLTDHFKKINETEDRTKMGKREKEREYCIDRGKGKYIGLPNEGVRAWRGRD